MRMTIEIFTLVLVIAIGTIMLSSMITVSTQNSEARDYFDVVRNRVENSDCNGGVINECINEAKKKGYTLEITDMTMDEAKQSMLLVMKYNIEIPIYKLIGKNEKREVVLEGYAR